jgi:2-polyprenyl-3-methyl-5-hydroxy-6-metoxy-1,4-benzoquinol methylase
LYGKNDLNKNRNDFFVWKTYFKKFLPENKNAKIIDVGCGDGGFVCWLSEMGYGNSSGIDFSQEQVKEAEKMGIKNIFRVDARDYLRDKARIFDLIFARDVFEHFSKQETMDILDLLCVSLKPGGKLIIQVANAENLFWGRVGYGDFTHETFFTERSARQVLSASGFQKIKVYPQQIVVHGVKSFMRFLLWKVFECCVRFYLLIEIGKFQGIFTQNIIVSGEKS